jgi:hypothetical protein
MNFKYVERYDLAVGLMGGFMYCWIDGFEECFISGLVNGWIYGRTYVI